MNDQVTRFSIPDYVVFALMLVISALIGFYYAWKDRKSKNVEHLLLAGRKLKIFPVAMSILASFTSAISVIGFSQEVYQYGAMYWLIGASYFITQPFAAHVYVPFFHQMKITSAYEYLERRFNRNVRYAASVIFCVQMILYMSVALYAPSKAIESVTGLELWIPILATGVVCTFYTSLGGMKAVVFTDTFQVLVMFAGLFAIIIEGAKRVGGFDVIYDRAFKGDRVELFDFDPSPFKRHTVWSLMIGGFFTSLTVYGSNQATIQRYLSVPTVRHAQISMYLNLIGCFLILSVCCMCGFVAYAFYFGCDPKIQGKINDYGQILPFLVMDLLKDFHGLPGLFIACVYSAALSTISSGLNSLTAVLLHDFIYPVYYDLKKEKMSEKMSLFLSKILAVIFGVITMALSFLCKFLGTTVLQLSLSIFGLLGGPLLGVISLGMFVKCANSYGALVGLLVSTGINIWLKIGSISLGKATEMKPFTQHLCPLNSTSLNSTSLNSTSFNQTSLRANSTSFDSNNFNKIYQFSYLWSSLISVMVVFTLGISISLLTRKLEKRKVSDEYFFSIKKHLIFFKKEDIGEKELKPIGEAYSKTHLLKEESLAECRL